MLVLLDFWVPLYLHLELLFIKSDFLSILWLGVILHGLNSKVLALLGFEPQPSSTLVQTLTFRHFKYVS